MLEKRLHLSRESIVGGECFVYNGQLRPILVRRLGMPVMAFMAYLEMMKREIEEENSRNKRASVKAPIKRFKNG